MMIMVVVLVAVLAGTAIALDTSTLTVTASVVGTCKFNTATATLDFGALDPNSGSPVNATTATVNFWCTKGIAGESITPDNGLNFAGTRQMLDAVSGDLIGYSLTLTPDANPNMGPGTPRGVAIDGTIAFADYANKSAGNYADTVILTINP